MIDVDSEVWNAFSTRLQTFAANVTPPLPYITHGVPEEPPNTGEWIEAKFFPNDTESYGMDSEGPFDFSGFCQVEVNTRPGVAIMGILALAHAIQEHFKMQTVLGPAYVNREPVKGSTPIQAADRQTLIVSVYYASHQMR